MGDSPHKRPVTGMFFIILWRHHGHSNDKGWRSSFDITTGILLHPSGRDKECYCYYCIWNDREILMFPTLLYEGFLCFQIDSFYAISKQVLKMQQGEWVIKFNGLSGDSGQLLSWFSHILFVIVTWLNTLRPRKNCHHFADDIFKRNSLNDNLWISLKISLKCVPKVRINNSSAWSAPSHYLNWWWVVYWRIY